MPPRRTHDDRHAIWIDPANSNHLLIGNDGGLGVSYDMAKTWVFLPNLPVGLFYHVSYDMATPYNVCGGMQDNYDWCGPSQVRGAAGIANYHWATIQGGDGFVVLQDPTDVPRRSTASRRTATWSASTASPARRCSIRPVAAPGEPPLRWHWDTPLVDVAARSEGRLRAGEQGVPVGRPGPDLGRRSAPTSPPTRTATTS